MLPMTNQEKTYRQKAGKLKITQDDVIRIVGRIMKAKGITVADSVFEMLNGCFSTQQGWPETAEAVYLMFDEERDRLARMEQAQQQRKHAEDMEMARAGAAIIVQNTLQSNEAVAKKDARQYVDQWNNIVENGAQVGYNLVEKGNDKRN